MRLLRRREVEAKTGLCRASIYFHMSRGTFPRPVKLGPRSVAWVEAELDTWINARMAAERCGGRLAAE